MEKENSPIQISKVEHLKSKNKEVQVSEYSYAAGFSFL